MRDKLRNEEHFRKEMCEINNSIQETVLNLKTNSIAPDRVNYVKKMLVGYHLKNILCKYSIGEPIDSLKEDLLNAIDITYESWFTKISMKKGKNIIILDQYCFYDYDEILWMLSLGYLLEIPDEYIRKIVDVIDRDKVKDFLLEFIIRAQLPDRPMIKEESYQRFFGIPDSFKSIREAIAETDKLKVELLMKEFVTKEWYKSHKRFEWCESKKTVLACNYGYYGYWSWGAAAVVKIMELGDSSFKDCPYYPQDMIT